MKGGAEVGGNSTTAWPWLFGKRCCETTRNVKIEMKTEVKFLASFSEISQELGKY